MLPQLARASPHPVYADLNSEYTGGSGQIRNVNKAQELSHQAIWNNRDDRLAYIGSDQYEITQHKDMIEYITGAVNDTVGEIDIGRIRDYGERIDGMVTLKGHSVDVQELVGEGYVPPESELLDDRTQSVQDAKKSEGTVRDILGVGVRFHNSFDASERIRLETMGYRFICQNWFIWGKETIGEFEQLHINELSQSDVESLIFDVLDKSDQREGIIVDSIEDEGYPLSWAVPALEDVGFGPRYAKRILEQLRSYGTVDDTFTRWELYNAATAHLDHDIVDDVNANVYNRHQGKATKLLTDEITSPSDDDIEHGEEVLEELVEA